MEIVQTDIWTFLQNTDQPIIIYGTGNGADKIINELERLSIHIDGVMASDDFVRGQCFRGFAVRKLSDFEKLFPQFIILTAFGTQRQDIISHIVSLSERHTVLAVDVPVYGDNIFNMDFYNAHQQQLEDVYAILADEHSKCVLQNIINFKLTGKLSYLTESFTDKQEIFDILHLTENESYLDLGAYRGDTIQEFLYHTNGHYRHITALEPDGKTFRKLKEYAVNLTNIQLWNMGIWDSDTDLYFHSSLGRGSSINTTGSQKLAVTKIDTLCQVQRVSYIKFDVEGAEQRALSGGIHTLQRDKPKLNLAVYHRSEDLFALPLLLHHIRSDYRIYLRQHPHIPAWDLNIYAL